MGSISLYARRLFIAGGFAVAAAIPVAGIAVAAPADLPTQATACPAGEETDLFTGQCAPYLVPTAPGRSATPASTDLCPAGVSGAECTPSTGNDLGSPQPKMPAAVPPQEPEQELADVVTPDY
ncbi:hypothetical protein [Mycolicibacterium sp. XJ1819]